MVATPATLAQRATIFLERPSKRQRREIMKEREMRIEEDASKRRARDYLDLFLENSEWRDRRHHITILRDAVPTMEELESFGELNQKEGTQACRRLFRAVVVWDELGFSLWQRLKAASESKRREPEMAEMTEFLVKATSLPASGTSTRRGSADSTPSRKTPWSIRSFSLSSENVKAFRRKRSSRTPSPDQRSPAEHVDCKPCQSCEAGHPGIRRRTGSIPWF